MISKNGDGKGYGYDVRTGEVVLHIGLHTSLGSQIKIIWNLGDHLLIEYDESIYYYNICSQKPLRILDEWASFKELKEMGGEVYLKVITHGQERRPQYHNPEFCWYHLTLYPPLLEKCSLLFLKIKEFLLPSEYHEYEDSVEDFYEIEGKIIFFHCGDLYWIDTRASRRPVKLSQNYNKFVIAKNFLICQRKLWFETDERFEIFESS